jgi:hypothetical protein
MKKMLVLAIVVIASLLTGCASLQNAGTASYTVQPFLDQSGGAHCCSVSVLNGKEIANLEAHIHKQGDDYTVDLKEQGVVAFQGQAIAAGATQDAINAAAKAAAAAALAPYLPVLVPAAGAALSSPGIGAAAAGGAAALGARSLLASPAESGPGLKAPAQ